MNYTLVGGGAAAVSALKAIRAHDPDGSITVVSEEEHCFYYRPMTPLVVQGDLDRDAILHDGSHTEGVTFIHERAVSLDAKGRTLQLAKGLPLGFDRLLIATGSSPFIPPIPGIREEHVHYLRTLTDAERMKASARSAKKAVILGGGFVGVKKGLSLRHLGLSVTIIEQQDHVLIPRLDAEAASMVEERLKAAGIDVRTKTTIAEILPAGGGVVLATGEKLPADMVCIAAGVRPNIFWLSGSGLAMDLALQVDSRMETNRPGIYAAGDVVQIPDLVTGRTVVSALWGNAVEMGKVAGMNMAGGEVRYAGGLEIMNATEIERLPMISVGDVLAEASGQTKIFRRRSGDQYRKLVFRDDRLAGFILVGDLNRAGICTALVKSAIPLGPLRERLIEGRVTFADVQTMNRKMAA